MIGSVRVHSSGPRSLSDDDGGAGAAVVPSISAQEATRETARDHYEALLKEYKAAAETWSKRVDSGRAGMPGLIGR